MSLLARNKYATLIHFTSQASVHHILGFLITVISQISWQTFWNHVCFTFQPHGRTFWNMLMFQHRDILAPWSFCARNTKQKHLSAKCPCSATSQNISVPKYLSAKSIHRDKILHLGKFAGLKGTKAKTLMVPKCLYLNAMCQNKVKP